MERLFLSFCLGLCFLFSHSGMVRAKNTVSTMMLSAINMDMISPLFVGFIASNGFILR
jgi:ammonia channel protein AmtB